MVALYERGLTSGEIAPFVGCTSKSVRRHLLREGIPRKIRYGPKSGHWKGGRAIVNGYVTTTLPPDHPMRCMLHKQGRVFEHRLVVAESLGRPLTSNESVHHVNGDKQDNRIENLQLFSGSHGSAIRAVCGDCGSRHIHFKEL